jgi:hypothetical protein
MALATTALLTVRAASRAVPAMKASSLADALAPACHANSATSRSVSAASASSWAPASPAPMTTSPATKVRRPDVVDALGGRDALTTIAWSEG